MTTVLLSSGGLDSAVIAAMHPDAIHLHVRYGQRNWIQEERASRRIADWAKAERVEVVFDQFGSIAKSTLTSEEGFMVGGATVVPNRNAMLISLGVSLAMNRGGDHSTVFIGCNANDYDTYPDCRPDFIVAASKLAILVSGCTVGVEAPLLHLNKREIGNLAGKFNVPVDLTWSCYAPRSVGWGQHEPCGSCGACIERGKALE